jgi:hypothetical protein
MSSEKTCEAIGSLMLLADSGELEAEGRKALAWHLASCAPCRRIRDENRQLLAMVRTHRGRTAPALSVPALEGKAKRRLLLFRVPMVACAVAALFLALLGSGQRLLPLIGIEGPATPARSALLDEWHFWMVSSTAPQNESPVTTAFESEWNQRDFARHLLVLEGLLPDEEAAAIEEEYPEATPGELPPITLRGCNTPELLRS